MKKIFSMILGVLLVSCFLSAKYEISCKLEKVVRNPIQQGTIIGESFEDNTLQVVWEPHEQVFQFILLNKTDAPFSVIWDECSFISTSGNTNKLGYVELDFSKSGKEIVPTTIPSQTKLTEYVMPADVIHWALTGGQVRETGSGTVPLIYQEKMKDKEYEKIKTNDIFQIILTLKKGEEKISYQFFFKEEAKQK